MKGRTAVGVLVASVLIAGCGWVRGTTKTGDEDTAVASGITRLAPQDRAPAPDITGDDLEGRPVDISQWRGKVVVINIWGSWCPPCRAETPALNRVANEMADEVEFLGIAVREGAPTSLAYTRKANVPYPSISDSGAGLLIRFSNSLPAAAVPTTYVLDRDGRVAVRVLDKVSYGTLKALVEDVLAEENPRG